MHRTPLPLAALLLAVLTILAPLARAAELVPDEDSSRETGVIKNAGSRQAKPEIDAASDEGLKAIQRMHVPEGLQIKLWAAEPMLANPVAFDFDEKGRIFVAETYRYRTSVLDIRDYMWLLEEELAARTIDDRTALINKRFGPAGVKELSIEGEVVRLLEDTTGKGVADKSSVYADGFNTPLDGIASGVIARRGKVWFTNIPSVWQLTGAQKAETRTEISRGYGVRFNFTGHDLHGLAWGPDGKLYFSNGDRGASVKTKEGGVISVPDTGAVFRCDPDGSNLELVMSGLRNPQSLAFTENGDLLTGDNDCDQGDEERLVHVVEGGDGGWRVGYQFPPLEKGSPWLAERLWWPRHAGQAAYILPAICNLEDGPSGIAYYPGTGLNASYRGHLFITHFKGAIAKSGIYTYTVKPAGASYAIDTAKPFLTSALPTDVKFGPDGRLYTSDWADGWPKSRRGRIYTISDPQAENDPLVRETRALIGGDWTKRANDELARLLGHADWRVRLEAQYTLVERGEASLPVLAGVAANGSGFARRHAIWGLGQLAAKQTAALAPLRSLLRDQDAEVRAQAIKVLGDRRSLADAETLVAALKDPSNRVKFFAAQGLGKLRHAAAAPALLAALEANNNQDHYLRHALVMGLVGGDNRTALAGGAQSRSAAVRLGVLLAYRRLGATNVAGFLQDSDPYLVREAALAINDAPINAALPTLAGLTEHPVNDEAVMVRALNAHFRLGQPANAQALAAYAARPDAPAKLRAEAVTQLSLWPKPPQRDRLVGIYRPLAAPTRPRAVAVAALEPVLASLLAAGTPAPVQAATLRTLNALEIAGAADTLFALVADEKQSGDSRAAALGVMDKTKHPRLEEAVRIASASRSNPLRLAALPITARLAPAKAVPVLANLVRHGDAAEQKAAFRALGNLRSPEADALFADQLRALLAGKVAPSVQLELLNAAARRSDATVKALVAEYEKTIAASSDPLAPFRVTLEGGDKERGRRIFETHATLPCIRCHRAGAEGGDAGPNLAGVGAKYSREYLLESVVKPNAKIAPGYDTVVVTLKSGSVVAGIVAKETTDTLS
jgi:quinoprotein glucose dehydrogenase